MGYPLEVKNLSVRYGSNLALQNANLQVPAGSMTGILGPNGAGKSTLLKAILGLEKTLSGEALFFGEALKLNPARVGYVPQAKSVDWDFPATVRDVVEMGTYGVRALRTRQAKNAAIADALWRTATTELADRPIGELSGGQHQRVFVARALVSNPQLLLLDEPFTGVDAPSEKFIMRALHEIQVAGATVVIVHHDLHTAPKYFDHVALLNRTVKHFGTTALTLTPEKVSDTFGIPQQDPQLGAELTVTGAIAGLPFSSQKQE